MKNNNTISQQDFKERFLYNPLEDLLGTGGFAEVYKAYDSENKSVIALKIFTGDNNTRYNIAREMQHLQNLPPHENLVQFHEIFEVESGNLDIHGKPINYQAGILEYANHGTLDDLMKTDIPESLKKKLLKDVLLGLQHLHKHHIVHRDLKPRNIVIHRQDGTLTAKITDFGIAKALEHTDTTESTTGMIGTVEYMAPEQIVPDQFGENGMINHKADLWSFGVLVYRWISGKSLYEGNSATTGNAQLIKAVLEGVPEEKINKLSSPYKEIIRSCLVQKAAERIDSADLVIKLLDNPESKLPIHEPKIPDDLDLFLIIGVALILIGASLGALLNTKNAEKIPLQDTILNEPPKIDSAPTTRTDDNVKIVKIGGQKWMTKNLDVSRFRNGDIIPEARTIADWKNAGDAGLPAWCYYDNDPSKGNIYGKLYNWHAVNDPRGLAPEGWHVSSDSDWTTLCDSLGKDSIGYKIKSSTLWRRQSNNSDSFGFAALPGGQRTKDGKFYGIRYFGYWWSSSKLDKINASGFFLNNYSTSRYNSPFKKGMGLSVRCVKD